MGEWIALIPRLLSLLTSLFEHAKVLRERGVGRTEALSQVLIEATKEVQRAKEARLRQRSRDAAVDDPRMHDDGFRRRD